MSRVKVDNRLSQTYNPGVMTRVLREITDQLNLLSEGFLQAATNAGSAAPTTGSYRQGDFVRHSAPSEAGGAGSKYVIVGFICTASGSPGTWKEMRVLTGN
jgi:hypothetical protein